MSLICYRVDMTSLDFAERKRIYTEADRAAFMPPSFRPGLDIIEFFLDENQNLSDYVKIPKSCRVVPSGSSSQTK